MDFSRVEHPVFAPSACLCGSADGPLIDTRMEKPAVGRVYLCHRCVHTAERALGGFDPRQRAKLEKKLDEALAEITMLRANLIAEQKITVSATDILELMSKHFGTPLPPARNSSLPTATVRSM